DLSHHRYVTWRKETTQTTDARRFADLLFQVLNQIGLSCLERRAKDKKHCRDEEKQQRDCKHSRVRPQFHDKRESDRSEQTAQLLEQNIIAPGAQNQADEAAAHSQQKAFAQ